ncbi:DUF4234 domain-containing protein [Candidatus Uhrbacteria bacterium]|nr:DUF4234 domain-containing protein [Candidatus Uhrbacteria bacterium]
MKCCKEESSAQCEGACGTTDCRCAASAEMGAEGKSCCGGGCSDCSGEGKEMACCEYEDAPYSNALDNGKFVVLSILSFGIYHLYWMYRNWKHIKEQTNKQIRPVGRTVAAFFPILDIIFFCAQFSAIHALTKKEGQRSFPLLGVCFGYSALLILGWTIMVFSYVYAGDPSFGFFALYAQALVALGATLILLPVQLALNDFWKRELPNRSMRTWYTSGEIAWIVVGGLFLVISLASLFIPPPLPAFDYLPSGIEDSVSSLNTR